MILTTHRIQLILFACMFGDDRIEAAIKEFEKYFIITSAQMANGIATLGKVNVSLLFNIRCQNRHQKPCHAHMSIDTLMCWFPRIVFV